MNKGRSRADARRGCRSRHPSAGAHPRAPRAHPGWTMTIVQPNPASTTAPRPGPFGGRGTTADARSGCKPVPLQPLGLAPTHNRADASCAIRQSCYVGSPRTPRLAAATPRPSAASATDLTPRRTGQWACVSQRRPLRPPPPPPSQTAAVLSWAKSRLTYGLPIRQSGDPEDTGQPRIRLSAGVSSRHDPDSRPAGGVNVSASDCRSIPDPPANTVLGPRADLLSLFVLSSLLPHHDHTPRRPRSRPNRPACCARGRGWRVGGAVQRGGTHLALAGCHVEGTRARVPSPPRSQPVSPAFAAPPLTV